MINFATNRMKFSLYLQRDWKQQIIAVDSANQKTIRVQYTNSLPNYILEALRLWFRKNDNL